MAGGDLTTLANVDSWLGRPSDSGAGDALIGALITAASAFVGSWLNRQLLSASYVEIQDANGKDFTLLANGPVTAVAAVEWPGTSITTAGDPIALTPGFLFDNRKLSLIGYWFPGCGKVRITYTAGYATVPLDIQQAVNELVGEAFRRRDRIGHVSKSLGAQETISFSQADMGASIKTLLMQYRNVVPN